MKQTFTRHLVLCCSILMLGLISFVSVRGEKATEPGQKPFVASNSYSSAGGSDFAQRKDGQRKGKRQEQGKAVKVDKVVPDLTVNPKVAKTLQTDPRFQRLVSVNGNTIKPKSGYVLAKLANGQSLITNGDQSISGYMEVITIPVIQGGIWVYACKCPKTVDGQEDGCKFVNRANPAQGCTGPACCQFISGYITDEGTYGSQVIPRN